MQRSSTPNAIAYRQMDIQPVSKTTNIFLVGPMGSGKSILARALALHLDKDIISMDNMIQEGQKASIKSIFHTHGEAHFRNLEHQLLEYIISLNGYVVDTGGGIVVRNDNRALMRANGLVIYVYASVEVRCKRLAKNDLEHRPMVQTSRIKESLQALQKVREPLYLEVANTTVVNEGSLEDVLACVIERL